MDQLLHRLCRVAARSLAVDKMGDENQLGRRHGTSIRVGSQVAFDADLPGEADGIGAAGSPDKAVEAMAADIQHGRPPIPEQRSGCSSPKPRYDE